MMRRLATAKLGPGTAALLLALGFGVQSVYGADQSDREGDFARGAKAWADNCARCHNMRGPKEFRDDLWRPIVTHMRVRAGLTGQEARDILTFLQASN